LTFATVIKNAGKHYDEEDIKFQRYVTVRAICILVTCWNAEIHTQSCKTCTKSLTLKQAVKPITINWVIWLQQSRTRLKSTPQPSTLQAVENFVRFVEVVQPSMASSTKQPATPHNIRT